MEAKAKTKRAVTTAKAAKAPAVSKVAKVPKAPATSKAVKVPKSPKAAAPAKASAPAKAVKTTKAPASAKAAEPTAAAGSAPVHGMSRVGQATRDAIVEGAYDLLMEEGVAGISTRRIAARANVNQALVHYHFGSVDQVMVEVLNRISSTVQGRNRDHYAGTDSFGAKYRTDLKALLGEDLRNGWGKVWLEAIALALNSPELLEPFLAKQRRPARGFVEEQVLAAVGRSDKDAKSEAEGIAALISIVRAGLVVDRLTGTTRGHARAIELLGEFLDERTAPAGSSAKKRAK